MREDVRKEMGSRMQGPGEHGGGEAESTAGRESAGTAGWRASAAKAEMAGAKEKARGAAQSTVRGHPGPAVSQTG